MPQKCNIEKAAIPRIWVRFVIAVDILLAVLYSRSVFSFRKAKYC